MGPVIGATSACQGSPVIQAAQKRKQEKRNNIGGANVKTARAPNYDRAQSPDDHNRPEVVAPLNAQNGHCLRRQKQQHGDAEVGRIPDVPPFHSQYVLRHYRDHAAQRVRPVGWRADQNPYADSRDVSTGKIQPLPEKDATENQLGDDRGDDRQRGLFVAFEDAVGEMTDQQDAGDKKRSDVTIVERDPSWFGHFERRSDGRLASRLTHAGSLILFIWLITGFSMV